MRFFNWYVLLGLLTGLFGCRSRPAASADAPNDTRLAELPAPKPGEAVMTVAAGCFWTVEEDFKALRGVRTVVPGYTGGEETYPTYEQVGTAQTGHAEAVQIYYDPNIIPYRTLLDAFFVSHDASSVNRQGPDVGPQYRSALFYRTPDERTAIAAAIKRENRSGRYSRPIATQVLPFRAFYPAERYHQNYCRLHPDELYVRTVSAPKQAHFRERMARWLKPDAGE